MVLLFGGEHLLGFGETLVSGLLIGHACITICVRMSRVVGSNSNRRNPIEL